MILWFAVINIYPRLRCDFYFRHYSGAEIKYDQFAELILLRTQFFIEDSKLYKLYCH